MAPAILTTIFLFLFKKEFLYQKCRRRNYNNVGDDALDIDLECYLHFTSALGTL